MLTSYTSPTSSPDPGASSAFRAGVRDTIIHALARCVEQLGDEEFANINGDKITFAEIDRRANAMARSFSRLGLKKGDTIATLLDTSLDVLNCWFAINKLGAIWVPINIAYRGEFLRHQIDDSEAKLVICDQHYLDRFLEIDAHLPRVKLILCRTQEGLPKGNIPVETLDAYRGDDQAPLPIVVEPSDLACLIYTSGTTGPSKGCMVSHNYMCAIGRWQLRAVPQTREDVSWTCLPLFHAAALTLVLGALIGGTRFAVWPRFSVSTFWDDVEQAGATNALLMASIFPLIAHAPDTDAALRCHGRLKMIYGTPISPEVRKIWRDRFGVAYASSWSYGQTEAVRLTMVIPYETAPDSCAGRPLDEFDLMIVDSQDKPLPEGKVGEIVFRPREANIMFEGYWRRPEDTAKAWRNLWMHTGDLGRLEGGFLYFADRAKDYLRSRGENVSSFEVERVFVTHPEIEEVAIHAVGTQDKEDDIKVTVVPRQGATLTEHELCLWSIEKLPHFAVPRYYEFRRELIKNPTGRVLKYKLREEGVTAATWDREAHGIVVRRR